MTSREVPLNNCKVELKLKSTKFCVLSAAGTDNTDDNPNNIISSIKETKSYVPLVTLSAKDNQKSLKLLIKGFARSVYLDEYKTKGEKKKIRQMNIDISLNQILLVSVDYWF